MVYWALCVLWTVYCVLCTAYCVSSPPWQIDLPEVWRIWKADKWDFLVVLGTFFGVIFDSIEIGILVGVCISMLKILVLVTRPSLTVLGNIPKASVYSSVKQYKFAEETPGILVLRVDAPILFTDINFIREETLTLASKHNLHNEEPLTVSTVPAPQCAAPRGVFVAVPTS